MEQKSPITKDKMQEYKKYMRKCFDNSCDTQITELSEDARLRDFQLNDKSIEQSWVDYIVKNGQGVKPVIDLFTKLIFLTNLKTDNESDQEKLDNWLKTKNIYNNSNYSTLQLMVTNMLAYGNAGARLIDNNLTYVSYNKWSILTRDRKDQLIFDELAGYYFSKNGTLKKAIDIDDLKAPKLTDDKVLVTSKGSAGIIPKESFLHLKYQAEGLYGISPLDYDQFQIKLSLAINKELISDVENDNIGRVFLTLKEKLIEDDESTNTILEQAINNSSDDEEIKEAIRKSVNQEVKTFINAFNQSKRNSITVVPGAFNAPEVIQPSTQAKDLLTILSRGIEIPARIYGIHPSLLGGANASNSSVTLKPLIEWTVRNAIVPMQKNILSQAEDLLKKAVGISNEIYFEKYDDTSLLDASSIVKNESQANLYNAQAEEIQTNVTQE